MVWKFPWFKRFFKLPCFCSLELCICIHGHNLNESSNNNTDNKIFCLKIIPHKWIVLFANTDSGSLEVSSKYYSPSSTWWDKITHQEFHFQPFFSILKKVNLFFGTFVVYTLHVYGIYFLVYALHSLSWLFNVPPDTVKHLWSLQSPLPLFTTTLVNYCSLFITNNKMSLRWLWLRILTHQKRDQFRNKPVFLFSKKSTDFQKL